MTIKEIGIEKKLLSSFNRITFSIKKPLFRFSLMGGSQEKISLYDLRKDLRLTKSFFCFKRLELKPLSNVM